ncbi:TonB-dependent receptor [Duganella sp. CF402]|uniref:TonB-dependent receptor n=1 Tax=unclassified Duganella TaxID=2636909 RepID=UPI0008B65BA0|nr:MULTISPECIES: TonB-dependent receptor [unclassified Duganella]RZT10222.1 TonB-dependent receptor [Duganella sp. BK701]SEL22892.1 TonB-dependent receptor [Duganella sp. CF402]
MSKLQKTAIAAAVAQIVVLHASPAWAQTTDTTATGPVVVVSGQRAALQSAQKLKQDADEVVDSIVAEDIGKLPDRSVTEVLQRIAGVTIDRNMAGDPNRQSVEGSGVSVRGLTYVRSEINGRDAFSAGGGRSLGFADVAPELMAGVDVYKNPSAEQVEGAVAALVNLRTALPFDYKGFKGVMGVSESYSTLRKGKPSPTGTILLSNRWATDLGEFGALIDIAHAKSPSRSDGVGVDPYFPHVNSTDPALYDRSKTQWIPLGVGYRSQDFDRTRRGDYAAFQWRPNKDLTASLTYFKTKYKEDLDEHVVASSEDKWYQQVASSNAVFDKNGAFQSGTISNPTYGGSPFNSSQRINTRESGTRDLSLNVQWRVSPSLTWTNDFQHVRSTTEGFDADVSTGFILPNQTMDMTGSVPQISLGSAAYMADAKNYYWAYTQEALDRAKATQKAWKSDFKYSFDDPVLRDVRFGVRFTDREGVNNKAQKFYNWQGITFPWMEGWQIPHVARLNDPRFAGGASLQTIDNFFGGKYNLPPMLFADEATVRGFPDQWSKIHAYHDVLCAEQSAAQGWGTCDTWKPATFNDPAATNKQNERTHAAYGQLRFGWDDLKYPVDGNVGLRYVKTNGSGSGYVSFTPPTTPTIPAGAAVTGQDKLINIAGFAEAQSYKNSYDNWLPSLNLRLKATDQLQFRFAVARGMSRPDFNQLQVQTTLSAQHLQTVTKDAAGNTTGVRFDGTSLTGTSDGNPLLKPTMSTNVDLTAEWYFAKAGSLTFSAFNKDLKDIIMTQNYSYTAKDVAGKPQTFVVTGPVNGANGYARGFEIAHQQYYDFVPDWLRGIGTQASWTYVDSERTLKKPVFEAWCSGNDASSNFNLSINGCDTDGRAFGKTPLQGLSRNTVNFAIMYEQHGLSMRLAYNWRSRYLLGVNQWGSRGNNGLNTNPDSGAGRFLIPTTNNDQAFGLPLYQAAYGQVDASIFYDFTDKFRVGLEGTNLTNSYTRQIMQQHSGEFTRQVFMSGPRYTLLAQYSF